MATGAADAYARMTGGPASTLLHLAPGMGNGYANLHNARKNRTPLINIVGDHATFHKPFDVRIYLSGSFTCRLGQPAVVLKPIFHHPIYF